MLPGLFDGRDKASWFFAWQSERIGELATLTGTVPTADQKAGRFGESIIDPLTGQPFANNTIPSGRFDPVFKKLVGFYPLGSLTFPETGRFATDQNIFNWTRHGWQPRLGLSYRVADNTVLRVGKASGGSRTLF